MYKVDKPLAPQELAKIAVEKYLMEGKIVVPLRIKGITSKKAGVFVTISNKKSGLRGCVGTVPPSVDSESIGNEIVQVAILSATKDDRFLSINKNELKDLTYSVDILETPVTVKSTEELNPKIYGVVVFSGNNAGVLLPDIKGVNDVKTQIKFARQNGNIQENEKITKIQKFKVKRFN
ncbi:MAG: hypothetical protein A2039_01095 [Candidatus Melainabacteria bacterium GWA2_34_9]|nr:MAG: hypothetical protein A2039_01095 [Candidatus Melainabacteria bacterium GWA2_34_9]